MKFNRQALIKACDAALKWDRYSWDQKLAKDLASLAEELKVWSATYGEAWAKMGLDVRRAIRDGRPVTAAMLPRDRYGNPAVFYPKRDTDRTYEPPRELVVLRRLLDTIVDEEISSSGLDAVGITSRVMREAAQFMVQGSVRV